MEDRISDSPDDVLHQILRFLPLSYAVRTSILSKRWRSLVVCSSCVDLNFIPDFYEDQSSRYNDKRNCNKNIRKKIRRFLYGINKVLRQPRGNNLNIQKFEVMIPFKYVDARHNYSHSDSLEESPLQSKLERWMSMVANPGLSVLDLRIFFGPREYYNFSLSTLAAAKSLKTLSLGGFQIFFSSSHGADFGFPCLEQLSLESVMLDDFVMQTLLQGSPLLEDLQLVSLEGLKILKVEGFSQLKVLQLVDFPRFRGMLVIDAPCLRLLEINVDPSVIILETCPQFLQELICIIYDIEEEVFQFEGTQLPVQEWFCRFFDKCRFLEHLTISGIPNVEKIHLSSTLHTLKTLTLTLNCFRRLVSFEIVAPNLTKLDIVLETPIKLPFIPLNASKMLEVVELSFHSSGPDCDKQWYTEWVEFLSYFKHSRALIIGSCIDERFFVPKESRKDLPRSLFGVKSLELRMLFDWPRPFSDYIDYMLWLSPRAAILTLQSFTGTEVVVKCLYDENKVVHHNEDNCCEDCNLLNVRCWRHSLKQVIIEKFEGDEIEKQDIQSFFQGQVKNLDSVMCELDSLEGGLYYYYDTLF